MQIWLDVTTILRWTRSMVGVVRVEMECAVYTINANSKEVRFCRFDKSQGRYCEVSRSDILTALARFRNVKAGQVEKANNSDEPVVPMGKSKEQRFKNLFFRCTQYLPGGARERLLHFVSDRKDGFGAVLRGYREFRHAINVFLKTKSGNSYAFVNDPQENKGHLKGEEHLFQQDDVYVSLGLDYDQKDLGHLYALKKSIGFKVLLFCYDTISVKLPHLCLDYVAAYSAQYFTDLALCADRILCISECTKKDLLKLLTDQGTPIPKITVLKLGCDLGSRGSRDFSSEVDSLIKSKFILYVSTIERRKNHEVLYRAYTRLVDSGIVDMPRLLFVGMPGWGVDGLISDLKLDPRIQPYVHILNDVSDGDLYRLYKSSQFTVYPSLYEGWGLPIAESLAAGKFCIASNVASIPEVGGDLIEYLDPWNVSEWVDRLSYFFTNPEEIARKEEKIRKEYQPTRWDEAASCILDEAAQLCDKTGGAQ